VLDAAFQLLREHTRSLFVLSTIVVIPGLAFGIVNQLVFGDIMRTATVNPTASLANAGRLVAVILPTMLLWMCWFMVGFGALISAASTAYLDGENREPGEALRAARSRAGTLVGAGLLTWLIVVLQFLGIMLVLSIALGLLGGAVAAMTGMMRSPVAAGAMAIVFGLAIAALFIVAGVALVGRYVALPAVIMHETLGARAAMRRARELARGSMRRIIALLLLVAVLFLIVSFGTLGVFMALLRSPVLASVLANIVNVPLYALAGAIVTVLYFDLRIRGEGLDIEMLAAELDALPPNAVTSEGAS
jgi:hypothetical protein